MKALYTTLFNRRYLLKGLGLLDSMNEHTDPGIRSPVFVCALDDPTAFVVEQFAQDWPRLKVHTVHGWEPPFYTGEQHARRQRMTVAEYCWSLASDFTEWVAGGTHLDPETYGWIYLDADCGWFADPVYALMHTWAANVGITPHRWTPRHAERLRPNGYYNVGYVLFRNNEVGRHVLGTWAQQVREWCYNRYEPGRFADQAYLNAWPELYEGVWSIRHLGVNLAPWNQEQYQYGHFPDDKLAIYDEEKDVWWPLVLYHFHELRQRPDGSWHYTNYPVREEVKTHVYEPYCARLDAISRRLGPLLRRVADGPSGHVRG